MREESGNTGMTAGTQDSRNTCMPPGTPQARLPEHMHASRNATGKTPGTWAGASEQAVEAPHLPERAKTPRRPALEGFEALGDAGLESASACGLGAEGP